MAGICLDANNLLPKFGCEGTNIKSGCKKLNTGNGVMGRMGRAGIYPADKGD